MHHITIDPRSMACTNCATKLDLQGKTRREAANEGLVVEPNLHDWRDCIRHLARAISEKEHGNTIFDWRQPY